MLQNLQLLYERKENIQKLFELIDHTNKIPATEEIVITKKYFENIDDYNDLMDYFKKLNVNIESSINYYENLNKDIIDANESVTYIRNLLGVKYMEYNNSYILSVSTNGIISEMTQFIKRAYKNNKLDELIKHLIIISKFNGNINIFEESNQYTNGKIHSRTTQQIKSENPIDFKYYNNNNNEKTIDFLTWIIQTIPPLMFYVPYNLVEDSDFKNNDYKLSIELLQAGCSFYSKLSKIINENNNNVHSEIDNILYIKYKDIYMVHDMFNWYLKDPRKCTLSRFVNDDGFGSSSYVDDYSKMKVFDGFYSHKYLDSRHLSTILLGSQQSSSYRNDIKIAMLNFIKNDFINQSNDIKLQYFTRIKLVFYELAKLDLGCQTIFKTDIINYVKNLNK